MADEIDRATENAAFLLEARIKECRGKSCICPDRAITRIAPTNCIDCGNHIPDARKKAAPGCVRCIGCQREFEEGR